MIEKTTQTILDGLVEISARYLTECLERAVRVAKSQLYEKLQHLSDSEQGDFSYAVNLLESNVDWIVSNISVATLNTLRSREISGEDEQLSALDADSLSLSLVSKDEFEDWLLVDVSKKKLERELGQSLQDLCQVISKVKARNVHEGNLSVGPESLLSKLKKAIDSLKIPTVAQITIYRSVTSVLTDDLGRMYSELLSCAAKHGVVPVKETIKNDIAERAHRAAAIGAEGQAVETALEETEQVVPPHDTEGDSCSQRYASLNTLARLGAVLQNGNRLGSAVSAASSGATPASDLPVEGENRSGNQAGVNVPAYEVSALLEQLRSSKNKQFSDNNQTSGTLREWVDSELKAGDSQNGLTQGASELIDVTDALFEAISMQIQGNKTLERWLQKLKVVILKSVLSDQSFFTNTAHPSRAMLNHLGNLAEIVESGHARLASILDKSIDKVIHEYDEDIGSIDDVVAELSSIFERHVAAYKRNSERLARSYEGKQKVAKVRHQVVSDLNELISTQPVPSLVMQLLDQSGWREYLALTAIRDGADSQNYQTAFLPIKQLIEWLTLLNSRDATQVTETVVEVGMEAPALLESLARELSGLGKSGFESNLEALNACLKGEAEVKFEELSQYEWPFGESESELEHLLPKAHDSSTFSRWHRQLMGMKPGDWIQMFSEDGLSRVLRLAWAGTESFRFVFVDTQGMKDEDMSIDELADRLRIGSAKLIEHSEVPLVDQGLHRMVQSTYEELSGQANCDALTGLLTRQALERALDQTAALSMSLQSNSAFLYADINNFNVANNTYGHSAGDAVLKHLANLLRDFSGENSFCGRLGGNEFGIVLQKYSAEQAGRVAESIRTELAQNPPVFKGNAIQISLSIGVAEIDHEVDDYDSVLRKSELACREAKEIASGGVVTYEPKSHDMQRRSDHLNWVKKLNGSLDGLLTLRVQEIRPVVREEFSLSHWEILLGVNHEGQVIPPSPLIEAAEHFGKMTLIDEWVVKAALRWMEENPRFVEKSSGFSINLSGNSLSDMEFLDYVENLVEAANVPANKICFEITETSAIINLNYATEFIRVLKKMGCKFALDDFGAGLSSYAYIQKLPVDYIKIDGMFIRNLANNENDQALVRSINELAHFMGIETVAEFVEDHEILDILKSIGVDHSQGFGIRKPMLMSELSTGIA